MASQEFDRAVVSPSLVRAIDINNLPPIRPGFELVPREWLPSECIPPEPSNYLTSKESAQPASRDSVPSKKKIAYDDQENDFQPPSCKKPRASLSLKKSSSDRFSKPVTSPQRRDAAKGVVPTNTKLNNEWAMRNLNAWIHNRNEMAPDDLVPADLLSCGDASVLCKWLCCFVQETKKENGLPYPATTIRSLLAAIQRVLHSNKVPLNLFDKSDMRFRDLHMTLDTVCVSLRKEGVGTEVKHAAVVSVEHEDILWKKGVLGVASPESLLRAVFYTVGLHFCLRGGQEHRDLKCSQFARVPKDRYDSNTCYQYVENGSKNYQGRFSETGQSNKIVRAYAQPNSDRCPVRLLDSYLSKLPPGSTAFYMQPKQRVPDPGQSWYKNTPVGVNPLKNMMTKISELGGLPIKYTNHSLRATSASRMFISGVPEKIVAEVTGHKSVKVLRQYERTTEEQYQAVGHSISHMHAFETINAEETVLKLEENEKVLPEKEDCKETAAAVAGDCKEKAAAVAGELQKSLPSISGTLSHCTFNFNFS
jgi:hypothetical protein